MLPAMPEPTALTDNQATPGREAEAFIIRLAELLHAYGTPAHRLEDALSVCARRFGMEASFFSMPTSVLVSFGPPLTQRTACLRADPGEIHLEKLVRLDEILESVLAEELSLTEGLERLDQVQAAPPRYPAWLTTGCFAVVSGAVTRFFGGGVAEIGTAMFIGLLIGLTAIVAGRRRELARLLEFAAGLYAAFFATIAAGLVVPLDPYKVMLGSLIILLPGLTLTVAVNELSTRNLVSGTARMANAMMIFIAIGFGVALGRRLGLALTEVVEVDAAALPEWTLVLALLVASLGLTVLFRARPRDVAVIVSISYLAFYASRFASAGLGPELGVFAAALIVGAASNLYSRLANRPAAVPTLPGVMLLVPGGVGFLSFASLLERDVITGIETAFTMFLVAAGLVAGLLVAQVAVPPRKSL